LAPIPCVSKTADMRRRECRDENTCGIRMVMKDMRNATARILDSTTLADVLSRVAGSVNGKPTLTYDF
jgi:DNA-binding IscR family transcriptional regulator